MNVEKSSASRNSTATSARKCMRPGPITKNGYLNYLREYRQKHCGLSVIETVRQGAAAWNKLSEAEKNKYTQMGCMLDSGRSASGGKCMRPGPITRNGYLNYLRDYRRNHCGFTAVETVIKGAAEWNKLSEEEKNKYTRMGCMIGSRQSRRSSRSDSRPRRSASAPRRSSVRSRSRARRSGRSRRRASLPISRMSQSRSRSRRSSGRRRQTRSALALRSTKSTSRSRQRRSVSAPRRSSAKSRSRSRSHSRPSAAARSRRSLVCHINFPVRASRMTTARSTSRKSQKRATSRRSMVCHRMPA